jgi:hypothetical protein
MGDIDHRELILRRRMAFIGSAMAVMGGCKDRVPPDTPPPDVTIGDADQTGGLPTATPGDSATPDPKPNLPPPPSTAIPETDCEADRQKLTSLKSRLDALYSDIDALYGAVPTGCSVTDESCVPKHRKQAKKASQLRDRISGLRGMCACPAPIVAEYLSKHQPELSQRLAKVEARVVEDASDQDAAAKRWAELMREEATPRPCLSCIRCEPKSGCD